MRWAVKIRLTFVGSPRLEDYCQRHRNAPASANRMFTRDMFAVNDKQAQWLRKPTDIDEYSQLEEFFMQDWMTALGAHYRQSRMRFPHDRLLVVFDIDGTILDMRYLVHYVLQWFDRVHDTHWFDHLTVADIDSHENVIQSLLVKLAVPAETRETILAWYHDHYWTSEAIANSHQPFDGVMQVIRRLQAQPNLFVGLNTGRFETQRQETLRSLNRLGARHGVQFQSRLLYLRSNSWERTVPESKVQGLRHFQALGYRPIAMLDNEPENLAAIVSHDRTRSILPMHADTLYLSDRALLPQGTVSGNEFNPVNPAYAMAPFPGPVGSINSLPSAHKRR